MKNIVLRSGSMLKSTFGYAAMMMVFSIFIISGSTYAKGIALGATRVIYPQKAKQTSLAITNSSPDSRFLVQSWVESSDGKKSPNFVITPPLFVSKAKSENSIRIMYIGNPLPEDRESVFWINSKAIPEIDVDKNAGKNVLQLAILSRIKLFVRPENLPIASVDAPDNLRFKQQGSVLRVNNPTPYFITLVNFTMAGKKLPNVMLSPLKVTDVNLPAGLHGAVSFSTINDYGAQTPIQKGVEG